MLRSHIQKVNQVGWQEAYRVTFILLGSLATLNEGGCSLFESLVLSCRQ